MKSPRPDFDIATADDLGITDAEIADLLAQVYVEGGYTSPALAASTFMPDAVRGRGILIGARDRLRSSFAGMIILVPPHSSARKLAGPGEAELHLLGVKPEFRQQGLGRSLIEDAIDRAMRLGYEKLILWTQPSMGAAQKLYEAVGFCHTDDFERNGRHFKLYERSLANET